MKALVTGAAGFIGSHLTEACLERGWATVAVDCHTTYYSPTAKVRNAAGLRNDPRCTFLEKDLLELDLEKLLVDVDVVFHLAAQAGVRASWGRSFDVYTELNITALQRLLEAAKSSGLRRFVFASSSSVYGDAESLPTTEDQILRPLSPYGATKAMGEHLLHLYRRNFGVPTVALRYFSVYGPRQRPDMAFHRLIEAALHQRQFPLYGDGGQTRDFTYVGDVVEATLAAAEREVHHDVYNVGGGGRVSMTDVIDFLQREVGNIDLLRHAGQRGDARDTSADIERARASLGYSPACDLQEGLRRQVDWHRSVAEVSAVAT